MDMAVTLLWIRDNFDVNKNRRIDAPEADTAKDRWNAGTITMEQYGAVLDAYNNQTILPEYTGGLTCGGSTTHYNSGCDLLKHYDVNSDGVISMDDLFAAIDDQGSGVITDAEQIFVNDAYTAGSINALCPGCHGVTPPPNTEIRTMLLSEGNHNIVVTLGNYETLNATIHVSSTNVSCVAGPCGTTGPPGVMTSGWTVNTYLKAGETVSSYADWVASKGGAAGLKKNFAAIGEIIDGYLASVGEPGYLGFTVTFGNIGSTIDYYLGA